MKPSVFVGSSSEGVEFARAIRVLLSPDSEVTLWNEGFFAPGNTFIETLVTSLPRFDFAVLVLTPDDLVSSRSTELLGPRDNVLFELGLFMGRLGRVRTFIVHQSETDLKIPSDLAGVITAHYDWPRADRNHQAAVGAACDSIRRAIRDLGLAESRINKHVEAFEKEQQRQKEKIDVLSFLVIHFVPQVEFEHLTRLAAGQAFPYRMHPGFEKELRHLLGLHFVKKTHDFKILRMPREGDLQQYFAISDAGRTYLQLREQYEGGQ
jgi:hypothetical protein